MQAITSIKLDGVLWVDNMTNESCFIEATFSPDLTYSYLFGGKLCHKESNLVLEHNECQSQSPMHHIDPPSP